MDADRGRTPESDEHNTMGESQRLISQLASKRKKTQQAITDRLEETMDKEGEATLKFKEKAQLKRLKAKQNEQQQSEEEKRSRSMSPEAERSVSPLRTSSPANLKASLKQKMADKIRAAKERAKGETEESVPLSGRKLAGKRSEPIATRFDDYHNVEEELRKSIELRRKKQQQIRESTIKPESAISLFPTQQEQYDFFTMEYLPEPEDELPGEQEIPTTSAEEKDDKEAGAKEGEDEEAKEQGTTEKDKQKKGKKDKEQEKVDDKKEVKVAEGKKKKGRKEKDKEVPEDEVPLLDDVDEPEGDMWKQYVIRQAEYKPFREKMADEEKALFVPPLISANIKEKLFTNEEPRYLEDEGFYIGTKPTVLRRNINRMENRLLNNKEDNAKWFGEDGCLISLPDPLKDFPTRPPLPEEDQEYTTYQKPIVTQFDSRYIDGSLDNYGLYQLDIDLNTVTFSHHHLFSREHVLAYRLVDLCKQYDFRFKNRTAFYLTEKLRALKDAAAHVKENIDHLKAQAKEGDTKTYAELENRLNEYRAEVQETRQMRDMELRHDRKIMKNIIQTWKQIKGLRETQGYTNTTVKLQIRKEDAVKKVDEEEWERDVQDEIEELKEDHEESYHAKLQAYKENLKTWKSQMLERKEAKKRQKERKKKEKGKKKTRDGRELLGDETAEEDAKLIEKDEEILENMEMSKPEKPQPLDEAELKRKILERFEEIRRKPGEPMLHPELTNNASITQTSLCSKKEQHRRNELSHTKCFIKILFNNKEVSRTPAKPVGQEFVIRFAQIFNVQIVKWPESIKLQLYETSGVTNNLLTEVFVAIPESNATSDSVELDILDFSSDNRISYSHEGVGSGVPFSFETDNSNLVICTTSGRLAASVSWGVDPDGNALVPVMRKPTGHQLLSGLDAVAAIGATGISDPEQLLKWIAKSRLDPNDPANASLMALLKSASGKGGDVNSFQMKGHFRLEQLQQEFDFISEEEMEASKRFKLIQYREQGVQDFADFPMIPAFVHEIPDDIFVEYERKKYEDEKPKDMDEIEKHMATTAKFLQKVREQIFERYRLTQHQKTLSEMVIEELVPDVFRLTPAVSKLIEPRHPLRPTRKPRKKIPASNLLVSDVKIIVSIERAINVPVRSEAARKTGITADSDEFDDSSLVRPFVEVRELSFTLIKN